MDFGLSKRQARTQGLWNLFMPPAPGGACDEAGFAFEGEQLTNVEYALCAEEMGRVHWAAEVFNCFAPDTGNMQVLHRFGSLDQKRQWLQSLMEGRIRSAFRRRNRASHPPMPPIRTSIVRDGDHYVISGRKR